jgi:hypothetical protein
MFVEISYRREGERDQYLSIPNGVTADNALNFIRGSLGVQGGELRKRASHAAYEPISVLNASDQEAPEFYNFSVLSGKVGLNCYLPTVLLEISRSIEIELSYLQYI